MPWELGAGQKPRTEELESESESFSSCNVAPTPRVEVLEPTDKGQNIFTSLDPFSEQWERMDLELEVING